MERAQALEDKLGKSLDEIASDKSRGSGGRFPRDRQKAEGAPYPPRNRRNEEGGGVISNRVYVGNLSYKTSWQNLKDHFKPCGNVLYANVFTDDRGNSMGCGIVEFQTKEEAEEAIKTLNDSNLDGRQVFVREDREDKKVGSGNTGAKPGCQVYVGNLSYNTTWQSLKDHFKRFGTVIRADILFSNGRHKGAGIVVFENASDAQAAIRETNNTTFEGRALQVHEDKFAQ